MKTIEEIRRENLAAIRARFATLREMSERLELGDAQISQWLNASINSGTGRPRSVGSDSCREIEKRLGLEVGWLDHEHDDGKRKQTLEAVSSAAMHPMTQAVADLMQSLDDHNKAVIYTNVRQLCDILKSQPAKDSLAATHSG